MAFQTAVASSNHELADRSRRGEKSTVFLVVEWVCRFPSTSRPRGVERRDVEAGSFGPGSLVARVRPLDGIAVRVRAGVEADLVALPECGAVVRSVHHRSRQQ